MSKKILITGSPGSGKTTLVQRVVEIYSGPAGGFYTQEIREEGIRQGFEIITLNGEHAILAHVDISSEVKVSKYGVDLSNLDQIAVSAILSAIVQGGLVVIDEIGPMEIASSSFRHAVSQALDSETDVLATITRRSTSFIDRIKSRPEITMIEITPENRDQLVGVILNMI